MTMNLFFCIIKPLSLPNNFDPTMISFTRVLFKTYKHREFLLHLFRQVAADVEERLLQKCKTLILWFVAIKKDEEARELVYHEHLQHLIRIAIVLVQEQSEHFSKLVLQVQIFLAHQVVDHVVEEWVFQNSLGLAHGVAFQVAWLMSQTHQQDVQYELGHTLNGLLLCN
jgi:hypothetical protein